MEEVTADVAAYSEITVQLDVGTDVTDDVANRVTTEDAVTSDVTSDVTSEVTSDVTSDKLSEVIDDRAVQSKTTTLTAKTKRNLKPTSLLFWAQLHIIAKRDISRDDTELTLITKVENISGLTIGYATLKLTPHLIRDTKRDNIERSCDHLPHVKFRNIKHILGYINSDSASAVFNDKDRRIAVTIHNRDKFIELTPLLSCPHVILNQSSIVRYKVSSENSSIIGQKNMISEITFKLDEREVTFLKPHQLNRMLLSESNLFICADILNEAASMLQPVTSLIDEVKYYLTLSVVGVSILCLAVTIVTYMRFPVLRSAAGWNNLFLCTSLIAAQSSLLASSL